MNHSIYILPTFLEENININNPLNSFDMNSFIYNYQNRSNNICPICLNKCINPSKPNSCGHIFCFMCINFWAKQKKICPICRRNFSYFCSI